MGNLFSMRETAVAQINVFLLGFIDLQIRFCAKREELQYY
jgi:hypothetical protein